MRNVRRSNDRWRQWRDVHSSRIVLSLLRLRLLREKVMGDDSGFFPSWVRDEVDSETIKDAVL